VRIDVFTIFPELIEHFCSASLVGRARRQGALDLRVRDLRSAATDPRRSVDDVPYGGGAGMVLAPGPLFGAVEQADPPRPLLLLSPGGRRLDQRLVEELAGRGGTEAAAGGTEAAAGGTERAERAGWAGTTGPAGGFSLLCGRYEGVDQRVVDHLVDGELSIGDYVLAGGEAAALVVVEAVTRLLPGVLGNDASAGEESFAEGLLEYPQYTRPARFRSWEVPEVLRRGDHGRIARWRRASALRRTLERRPDLLEARGGLSEEERQLLSELEDPPPERAP
jgi:tRNA (guanine37-N1)-methyltransferase